MTAVTSRVTSVRVIPSAKQLARNDSVASSSTAGALAAVVARTAANLMRLRLRRDDCLAGERRRNAGSDRSCCNWPLGTGPPSLYRPGTWGAFFAVMLLAFFSSESGAGKRSVECTNEKSLRRGDRVCDAATANGVACRKANSIRIPVWGPRVQEDIGIERCGDCFSPEGQPSAAVQFSSPGEFARSTDATSSRTKRDRSIDEGVWRRRESRRLAGQPVHRSGARCKLVDLHAKVLQYGNVQVW